MSASLLRTQFLRWSAILGATLLLNVRGYACATATGHEKHVSIVEESAIIVWDPDTHTEHFIRRASFQSEASDFGFLVPTPTAPKLAEAQNDVFDFLEKRIEPEVITKKRTGFVFTFPMNSAPETAAVKAGSMPQAVHVLDARRVAGYDAVVLEADNAKALNGWLKTHGYASRPALEAWLAPYVTAHWKITTFRIAASDPKANLFSSSAVRMSFTTEKPFYPYREPADSRSSERIAYGRSLRVFFFGSERVAGVLGQQPTPNPWPGKTVWASTLNGADHSTLTAKLDLTPAGLPAGLWMTTFEDRSSPRPGTDDVFFSRAADQSRQVPPPIVVIKDERIVLPLLVVVSGAFVGLGVMTWLLRRRITPVRAKQSRVQSS